MSFSGVPIATEGSYPIGIGPESHVLSSNPAFLQTVLGMDASLVPLRYFQTDPALIRRFDPKFPLPFTEARQLPPRALSKPGLISSMEYPGGSPTMGQGNPSP